MSSPFPFLVKRAQQDPATAPVARKKVLESPPEREEPKIKATPLEETQRQDMKVQVIRNDPPAKASSSDMIVKRIKMAKEVVREAGIDPESAGGGIIISKLMDMIQGGPDSRISAPAPQASPNPPIPDKFSPEIKGSEIENISLSRLAENLGARPSRDRPKASFIDDLKMGSFKEK